MTDAELQAFLKSLVGDNAGKFTTTTSTVVTCKACKAKNRLKAAAGKPRCGKCGLPL